jgi:hypothetical protein
MRYRALKTSGGEAAYAFWITRKKTKLSEASRITVSEVIQITGNAKKWYNKTIIIKKP